MPMDNNAPPEDSIFSLPSYRASQFGSGSSQVQMNPATAMQQGQIKSTVQNIVRGVSVAVLMLAIIGGGTAYMLKNTATSTQASIDLKHAVLGTVGTVDYGANNFSLTNSTSDDPKIKDTGITNWTIQLPPGASFTKESASGISTCNTIPSLDKNLTEALPVSCVNFIREGDKAVIEYLIVKAETATIITNKIIKEE
jgi:hypothetical protein